MTATIHIPPPLSCGACGALVDERQAWRRWPQHTPEAGGEYLVLLQAPDTMVYQGIATWKSADATWRQKDEWFVYGEIDVWPIAWRHLPPLPEWVT